MRMSKEKKKQQEVTVCLKEVRGNVSKINKNQIQKREQDTKHKGGLLQNFGQHYLCLGHSTKERRPKIHCEIG